MWVYYTGKSQSSKYSTCNGQKIYGETVETMLASPVASCCFLWLETIFTILAGPEVLVPGLETLYIQDYYYTCTLFGVKSLNNIDQKIIKELALNAIYVSYFVGLYVQIISC